MGKVVLGLFFVVTVGAQPRVEPLTGPSSWVSTPALSPDGSTLMFFREDELVLRSQADGATRILAGKDDRDGSPDVAVWSPNGQRVAFLRDYCHHCSHELFLKDAVGGSEFPLGESCGAAPSWAPDGRFLFTSVPYGDDEECQLALIPTDGSERTILTPEEGTVAAVSPDGKRLLYAAGNVIKLVRLGSNFRFGGVPVEVASEPHAISSIHWAADGASAVYQTGYAKLLTLNGPARLLDLGGNIQISQLLADGSALGTEYLEDIGLWREDLKTGVEEKVRDIAWTDSSLAVSPNGESVAFVTERKGPSQIWVSKLDGSEARVLIPSIPPYGQYGDNTMAGDISWSPDGQWVAFLTTPGVGHGDPEARLFVVLSGGGSLRVVEELCAMDGQAVPWSSDSKTVFVAQQEDKPDGDFETLYFQVDILTGKRTPVSEGELPPSPRKLAPQGAQNLSVTSDGHFLFFQKDDESRTRIVKIHNLLPAGVK